MAAPKFNPNLNKHNVAYRKLQLQHKDASKLYEPEPGQVAGYLNRNATEDAEEFSSRAASAYQINLLRDGVLFYQSQLHASDGKVTCDTYEDIVNGIVANFTLSGKSMWDFARDEITPNAFLDGSVDIFGDLTQPATAPISLAEELASEAYQPYYYVTHWLNRVQWTVGDDGEYLFYQSKDIENTEVNPGMGIQQVDRYAIWTPETYCKYDTKGKLQSEVPNPYGFIPAVTCIPFESRNFPNNKIGIPLIQDAIELQKNIINKLSLIDNFHSQCSFSIGVLKDGRDNVDPGQQPEDDNQETESLGNNRLVKVVGANSDFNFRAPDPRSVLAMQDWLLSQVDQGYRSMGMPINSVDVKTHTSANSIKATLGQTRYRLRLIAASLERTLKSCIDMGLRLKGLDPVKANVKVSIDKTFSLEALMDGLVELKAMRDAAVDQISRTYYGKYTEAVMARAVDSPEAGDEVEAWAQSEEPLSGAGLPAPKDQTDKPGDIAPADDLQGTQNNNSQGGE